MAEKKKKPAAKKEPKRATSGPFKGMTEKEIERELKKFNKIPSDK